MDSTAQKLTQDFKLSNPFPGLRSFEEDEHILFFGRENQVDDLMTKLRKNKFLAVIGTSGSGKSSLVKSGLLPALNGGFMASCTSQWITCSMRPGNDPIGNMAKSLSHLNRDYLSEIGLNNVDYSDVVEAGLRRGNNGLIDFYHQNLKSSNSNLLLLIDQFEELFRFSNVEKSKQEGFSDSKAFVDLLLTAVQQSQVPIFIVFTMRSDFLGDCTAFNGLPEAINDGHYLVPRMTREEIRRVVVGPVAVAKGEISNALVNRLLNDLGDNPDQLPILQHAMMRVWNNWVDSGKAGPMDISHYEEIGTLKGALSQHAEEAFEELPIGNDNYYPNLCRSIFKALTDRSSDSRGTRRPTQVKEMMLLTSATLEDIQTVSAVFREEGRGFLMPDAQTELSEESILDISHESLMRVWVRLQTWVEEENESIQMYLRLTEASEQYENRRGGLWRNPELSLAVKWKNENNPNPLWASRINNTFEKTMLFLDYSIDQQIQEERHKEYLQKARLRRARIFAITVGSVAMVAFGMALWANSERKVADKAQKVAMVESKKALQKSEELKVAMEEVKESNRALDDSKKDLEIALLEAKESEKKAKENEKEALKQKLRAEQQTVTAQKATAEASRSAKVAMLARDSAEASRRTTDTLKNLSDANALALESVTKFTHGDYEASMDLALDAYKKNESFGGAKSENSIINALYVNWNQRQEGKNILSQHKVAVRSADVSKSGKLISIDESRNVVVSEISGNSIKPLLTQHFDQSISNVLWLDEKDQGILVLFKNGELKEYSYSAKAFKLKRNIATLGLVRSTSKIKVDANYIWVQNGNQLNVISNKGDAKIVKKIIGIETFATHNLGSIVIVNRGKINGFLKQKDFIESKSPTSSIQLKELATCATMNHDGSKFLIGTQTGMIVLGEVKSGLAVYNDENDKTSFPRIHFSKVSDVLWLKSLNGKETLLSVGYDHSLRFITYENFVKRDISSNLVRLDIHKSWIYGMKWVESTQGLITYSEDKNVIYHNLSAEELYKSLK